MNFLVLRIEWWNRTNDGIFEVEFGLFWRWVSDSLELNDEFFEVRRWTSCSRVMSFFLTWVIERLDWSDGLVLVTFIFLFLELTWADAWSFHEWIFVPSIDISMQPPAQGYSWLLGGKTILIWQKIAVDIINVNLNCIFKSWKNCVKLNDRRESWTWKKDMLIVGVEWS